MAKRDDGMGRHRGYVIWEGPSPVDGAPIAVIATVKSSNRKTGDMVQTWILLQDQSPMASMSSGADVSVCGDCPHRGHVVDGKRVARACYVDMAKAPTSVWNGYIRGIYPRVTPRMAGEILAGRAIRLGAYGDPGMVPLSVWRALVAHASKVTGYTHQWRRISWQYRQLLMASADSVEDYRDARRKGYRAFVVVPSDAAELPSGTVLCMSARDRNPLQCIDCGACSGTRNNTAKGAVSIAIRAHGAGSRYVSA